MKIIFLTKYDHACPRSPHGGPSMTDQQYRDECDIDIILKRYKAGEPLPENHRVGKFGDFSEIQDFESCLQRVNNAMSDFEQLPAVVKDRFGNDPRAFYRFTLDPANTDECRRLGHCKEVVPEVKTPVTAPAAAEANPPAEGNA